MALQRPAVPSRLRVRSGQVNFLNIHPLQHFQFRLPSTHLTAKVSRLNCRSLSNKSFILNDFFTQQDLDLLFLMETWISDGAGESYVFGKLCPTNNIYKHSQEFMKRWQLALIFKIQFKIQLLSAGSFSSEVCVKVESVKTSLVCVLLCRLSKTDKKLLTDFSDFLSRYVASYDCMQILGDFNIHVCCPGKPLVSDLCHMLYSFGFYPAY